MKLSFDEPYYCLIENQPPVYRLILLACAMLLGLLGRAQISAEPGRVSESIQSFIRTGQTFERFALTPAPTVQSSIPGLRSEIDSVELFLLDEHALTSLLSERPRLLTVELPSNEGELVLDLYMVDITGSGFVVKQSSDESAVPYQEGAHYRGVVRGVEKSLVALSFFQGELMALIVDTEGARVIGPVENDARRTHVMYHESKLNRLVAAKCETPEDGVSYSPDQITFDSRGGESDCVRLYWEVNFDIFQDKGSVANATNYVTGLFNQSAAIFANDGISVVLSQVYVWNTASPYTGSNTNALLSQFQTFRNSFNGDLAHLLGYVGNGGVAAGFDGLCNSDIDERMCYSDINSSYDIVPDYSWSVNVVTHEQGHLLGSRHTHACVWNGNSTAIDDCGNEWRTTNGDDDDNDGTTDELNEAEGWICFDPGDPILPSSGTVMSYCHLLSSVEIDFANGFGLQPRNVILNSIGDASCLSPCPLVNDDCAGSIELVSSTSCDPVIGTVEEASADNFPADPPDCDDADTNPLCTVTPDRAGVFFRFTAVSQTHTIEVDPIGSGAGSLDAVVVVYSGTSCFTLNEEACEDTPGGQGGTTILTYGGFNVGEEYWIRVYDWCSAGNVTNGSFNICVTHSISGDITIENVLLDQPSYSPGQTIVVDCDQCYSGPELDADLPNPNIIAYLSTSCNPADALDSDVESSGIGSNDPCDAENFNLDIPLGTPSGTYYVVIHADAYDDVTEGSGESNNIDCIPITIEQGCTTPAVPIPVFGSTSCPGPSMSSAIPLEWNPVPGAIGYRLRVGIYPYEEGIFIDVGAGDCYPGTSYSIPIALFTTGIPCYWSVSAYGECGNDACQSAYSTPRYFTVPPVVLATNGTTICDGESADLALETLWVVDAPGTNSAQWYRNGQAIPGATGGTYTATQAGGYSVVLTSSGSLWCTDPVVLGPSNIIQVVVDNLDTDGDGVPNCTDNCPNVAGQIGSTCNDGNTCTINDVLNASCQCTGTLDNTDTDGDGVPNCTDNCPNVFGQIGSACDDGSPCTTNDLLNASCQCAGTLDNTDTDGDGVPNCTDSCPNVFGQIGSACNDGNPCTTNDLLNASCQCAGTLDSTDIDSDGVPNCTDNCPNVFGQIGSACDDGDPCTINDVLSASCQCIGIPDSPLGAVQLVNGPPSISVGMNYDFWITEVVDATSYDWSFNGSTWTNTTNDSISFTILGLPTEVCVRPVNDCSVGDSTCVVFDFSTSIEAVIGVDWFTIHPNPSSGIFQLMPTGPKAITIEVRVYDPLGQLVAAPLVLAGSQPELLDLHSQADGIYFLHATKGSERQILELVIQR